MLPPITTTNDNPATTADDNLNLPPSSIYQCVGFSLDVRGPGFLTGDVTWSVLNSANVVVSGVVVSGQNSVQAQFNFDDSLPVGNYTIRAASTATPANVSTHTIQVIALPPITIGTPNQPTVGGQTQFNTSFPFPITWTPAEVNASGLATWTTAGTKLVTYTTNTTGCPITLSYLVYPAIQVEEYDGNTCLYLNSGQSLALTVTGGSGAYTFSITGQNNITAQGVIEAGLYAGEYTLSIVDKSAGLIKTISVCVGSQTQFCVEVESSSCVEDLTEPCCEVTVDCGESILLKVPTFHLRINGDKQEVRYTNYGIGTIGEAGYLKSGSAITTATGNEINCSSPENLFEIVTSLDMADIANAPFGIGFSRQFESGVNQIDNGVVWYTSAGVRYVEVRKEGAPFVTSRKAILHGDIVSAGYKDGKYVLYINNLLKFETADIQCCGKQSLTVVIEQANKSLGGNLTGLTWTIITPGTPDDVGSINSGGNYTASSNVSVSLVQAEASVGNAKFRINIRKFKLTITKI